MSIILVPSTLTPAFTSFEKSMRPVILIFNTFPLQSRLRMSSQNPSVLSSTLKQSTCLSLLPFLTKPHPASSEMSFVTALSRYFRLLRLFRQVLHSSHSSTFQFTIFIFKFQILLLFMVKGRRYGFNCSKTETEC